MELDKYIVGQDAAKKAVAIAIRNRWRRQQLPAELRDDVAPKNIILMGPTGVGKTEIARRVSNLVKAPFIKVEASKYTEVGYVGRDVESMVRDLVEHALNMVRHEEMNAVRKEAQRRAEDRLIEKLLPRPEGQMSDEEREKHERNLEKMRKRLRAGKLDDKTIELAVETRSTPMMQVFSAAGIETVGFENLFEKLAPKSVEEKQVSVREAREILAHQESEKLLDHDRIQREALKRTEQSGIVFLDELDKIASRGSSMHGPDVSGEGVQRDLLPIIEGSTVATRYGPVRTDHILFIGAGAFHMTRPQDMIPELQGRFPIRVRLSSLDAGDFVRILTEPKTALTKQYAALLETEGVKINFRKEAIEEIARVAEDVNSSAQDIGARRLFTILEKLLEDLLFEAPDMEGTKTPIDLPFVKQKLENILEGEEITRAIGFIAGKRKAREKS
jgi:ATP-dependent HslUV protease ATP-binding subunit HslU